MFSDLHIELEKFICSITRASSCRRSPVCGSGFSENALKRNVDRLNSLLTFLPELVRAGLDVVVLDDLGCVRFGDIDRVFELIVKVLDLNLKVVLWGRLKDFVELSSFRDVVSTDDFIRVILRDFVGRDQQDLEPELVSKNQLVFEQDEF
ncbi:hypothetical protein [Hydrogenophaga sp.]|uniref:hypothetical protein n=1 Tax=Hydrogenophaga sp. TaxID=1904254 RepID=UPI00286E9AFF|nr:hypothetical protein [Hydrogenophaga sp.]